MSAPSPLHHHHHHHRSHRHSSRAPSVQKETLATKDEGRTGYIIDTFLQNFSNEMRQNPHGWRGRFRKMAANEFAFYRGSAVLFYRDVQNDLREDRWLRNCKEASKIFIHGDLHAENFGTYIDREGIINFDVNDFDEGYLGPFIWDVKRLVVSINLITHSKAYSDEKIVKAIDCLVRSYLAQIHKYCNSPEESHMSLTSENTTGAVNKLLKESRLGSKEEHLNKITVIDNYDRKFIRTKTVKDIDDQLRYQVQAAFQDYIKTIPANKKGSSLSYKVKDIVSRTSPGIGSSGRTTYNILVQGKTQALESDVVLFMKPATNSAVASVIRDTALEGYFRHGGLRTVLCAYAMHAVTSKWLGYTTLNNQIPLVVDEVSTHSQDLEWDNINDFEDLCQTVEYMGRAMAKIHCVSDTETIEKTKHAGELTNLLPLHVIPQHTERTIQTAIGGDNEGFIRDMISFAMLYGKRVRQDHELFLEAFRNEQIPILDVHQSHPGHHCDLPKP